MSQNNVFRIEVNEDNSYNREVKVFLNDIRLPKVIGIESISDLFEKNTTTAITLTMLADEIHILKNGDEIVTKQKE